MDKTTVVKKPVGKLTVTSSFAGGYVVLVTTSLREAKAKVNRLWAMSCEYVRYTGATDYNVCYDVFDSAGNLWYTRAGYPS